MSPKNTAKAEEGIQDQVVDQVQDMNPEAGAKPKLQLVVSDEGEQAMDPTQLISDSELIGDMGAIGDAGLISDMGAAGQIMDQPVSSVQTAKFGQLNQSPVAMDQHSMDLLLDVDLDLSVELGRAAVPVKEILQLGSGSIVELNKLAGDSVDVLVNGRLIARGEVVVVDENFGVRITEILSTSDRISRLG